MSREGQDGATTLPHDELILHTADGIPYVIPEVVLLFKAKARRAKDEADFLHALPAMDISRRSRLSGWLSRVHPGHPWLATLSDYGALEPNDHGSKTEYL